MRTSRISKETAHVVSALARPRRVAAQQALKAFAYADPAITKPSLHENGSDSELSAPPDSPDADEDGTSRKRKRGQKKEEDSGTGNRAAEQPPATKSGKRVKIVAPQNWEQMYAITTEMRKKIVAPVDTMGCESLAEAHRSPLDRRLQTLVALMLSSQTKDTVTAVAMKQLQEGLPGGFNLEALLQVSPEQLNQYINKVGFHNNKTRFIKQVAMILKNQFGGDIPDTIEGLVSLPGVGPKMAFLTMSAAWGRDEGIGVDVHVHRITNLWHWHKTNTPEQTRAELESWLPRDKWHPLNHLLVGLGQTICLPVGRRCDECDLGKQKLCPSAVECSPRKKKKKVMKKDIEIKVESDEVVTAEAEADDAATTVHIKSEIPDSKI